MDLVICKMLSFLSTFKNKLLLSLSKDFKIKLDKNNYMLFKKEEDYNILFYLQRIFFDLNKNLLYNYDEKEKIKVFFRLSLIRIILENLFEIEFKIFYDKRKYENPFIIKFPNLSYLYCNNFKEIDILIQNILSDEFVEKLRVNYGEINNLLGDVLFNLGSKFNIKYYKI